MVVGGAVSQPPSLEEVRLQPVASVVAALEDLLQRAREGEVRGFAMVACADRRDVGTIYEPGDSSIADLVYGVEVVKARLMEEGL